MVFLTACTGVWADTVTILIKEGSGMKRCLGIVQTVVGKLMDVRA